MSEATLTLVLGDQLSLANPALVATDRERDVVLLAEVAEEAAYVAHNRHKIALIFSAMRHFRAALEAEGYTVHYIAFEDGVASLEAAARQVLKASGASALRCCEPGEARLAAAMGDWEPRLGVPVTILDDSRFLCSRDDFTAWAKGRKQLRMEYFYREMRRRYGLLLDDDGQPEGGQWNYDADNRSGWRDSEAVPERPAAPAPWVSTARSARVFPKAAMPIRRRGIPTSRP
jgi:deoxyribodipyrimidine photolyase-related protein